MSFSFTSIDFETANARRGSVCSVGLTKVVDGVVTASTSWLIAPPDGGDFDAYSVGIHGITADDVQDAPDWASSLPRILNFVDGDVVVAHNAAFDAGVLRAACDFAGLAWPTVDYTCTLVLSRALLDLPAYKLPWVAEALAIPSFDHHEAGADATAAALIAIALAESRGAITIQDLVAHAGLKMGRIDPDSWSGSRKASNPARARLDLENLEVDPNGPMAGEVVCFTGKISWVREDAQAMVIRHGGSISKKPTLKTTLLVTGDFDERTFRPGMKYSSSIAKAFALVEGGQTLEIMTEADFRQKLEPEQGVRKFTLEETAESIS
jgi:DNA polymerase III epsilon subunit-like protein